jgi:hypothetical protein
MRVRFAGCMCRSIGACARLASAPMPHRTEKPPLRVEISDGSYLARMTPKGQEEGGPEPVNRRFTSSAALRERPAVAGCAFCAIGAGAS